MTTHAIGNNSKVAANIGGVIVFGTDSADIGVGSKLELKGHSYAFSSMTVCPIRTPVPGSMGMVRVSLLPSTKVPFVEPTSSKNHRLPCGKRRAWRPEA